ncbi:MAG: hypothetical protein K8S20_18300 [Chloroflexi bacterium]|nr:hypothetical protein [Chloroflexota bacterium]
MEEVKPSIDLELLETREKFLTLVNSISEEQYSQSTDNSAWTVGEILFHITLGPRALALEIWLIIHFGRAFQFIMHHFPSRLFNWINARFVRRGGHINRQMLIRSYEVGHAAIRSGLMRAQEEDMRKSVVYPREFVTELAGECSVERLFRYVKGHFEVHSAALRI